MLKFSVYRWFLGFSSHKVYYPPNYGVPFKDAANFIYHLIRPQKLYNPPQGGVSRGVSGSINGGQVMEQATEQTRRQMRITVNGEERKVTSDTTVAQLLERLEIVGGRIAVERNLEIVPRSNFDALHLREGDKLEIVHFVGGG